MEIDSTKRGSGGKAAMRRYKPSKPDENEPTRVLIGNFSLDGLIIVAVYEVNC